MIGFGFLSAGSVLILNHGFCFTRKQVNKGGETMITKAEKKSGASSKRNATTNKNQINKNLHRY